MRKLWLCVISFVLLLPITTTLYANETPQPQVMAQYFPADTVVFLASRIDTAFIDLLEDFQQRGMDLLPPDQRTPPLRDLINETLVPEIDMDVDTLLAMFRDYGAIGILPAEDSTSETGDPLIVLELSDRAAFETLIDAQLPEPYVRETVDGATVYTEVNESGVPFVLTITDEMAIVSPQGITVTNEDTLNKEPMFTEVLADMPQDVYNMMVYVNSSGLVTEANINDIRPFVEAAPALGVGFVVLDGRTLVMDVVRLRDEAPANARPLNMEFADYIPTEANAMIHMSDLAGLYRTGRTLMVDNGMSADVAQIEDSLSALGIDLETDLLSWATGDFALYLRFDVMPLLQAIAPMIIDPTTSPELVDISGRFDLGLVIEATDNAAAATLAEKIGTLAGVFLRDNPIVSMRIEDEMYRFTVDVPPITPLEGFSFDMGLGATDDVFFFVTNPDASPLLSDAAGLRTNPSYQDALLTALPNPTSLWYADAEGQLAGTGTFTIVTLALIGPAVSNVFEDIVEELEAGPQGDASALRVAYQQPNPDIEAYINTIENSLALISSSSVSTVITPNGSSAMRFAISYAE